MKRTPTSVMVLGIIGIVLACTGFLGVAIAALGIVAPSDLTPSLNKDLGYISFVAVFSFLNLLIDILLISASISSIRLKPWARKGMLLYAIASLVLVVITTAGNYGYTIPKFKAAIDPKVPPDQAALLLTSISIAPLCGLSVAIYPIFVLIFFTRKKVVDAFKGIFSADLGYAAALGNIPPPRLPDDAESPFP